MTNVLGPRLSSVEAVADVLRRRIALGGFPPGSRLPTERELAAMLGVGRNTVREAIRTLGDEGLVSTTRGRTGGSRVTAPSPPAGRADVAAKFSAQLRDYMEYRMAVEPEAARLAAQRASVAQRRRLTELLDEPVTDVATYHRIDTEFHLQLAHASGNPVLADAVTRAREEMFIHGNALWLLSDWATVYSAEQSVNEVFRAEHRVIARAVADGDAAAAERAMRAHLTEAGEQFERLLSRLAGQ
ncbi:MAG: FadR/GntR family transcriptional regulator [Haloechinothrix sp.]